MPVFKELSNGRGRLERPEERKAEELKRSRRRAGGAKTRKKDTSVPVSQYRFAMTMVTVGIVVLVLAFAAFLVYTGVTMFIPAS